MCDSRCMYSCCSGTGEEAGGRGERREGGKEGEGERWRKRGGEEGGRKRGGGREGEEERGRKERGEERGRERGGGKEGEEERGRKRGGREGEEREGDEERGRKNKRVTLISCQNYRITSMQFICPCTNMHVRTLYVAMHFHNTCRYADRVHTLTLQAYVHRRLYSNNIILMIMLCLRVLVCVCV